MRAAGTGGAGAHRELAGELGLAGGGQRRSFLMADADPFDAASPDRVGERVRGVADQSENMPDSDLFEHPDQEVGNRLRHGFLPIVVVVLSAARRACGAYRLSARSFNKFCTPTGLAANYNSVISRGGVNRKLRQGK